MFLSQSFSSVRAIRKSSDMKKICDAIKTWLLKSCGPRGVVFCCCWGLVCFDFKRKHSFSVCPCLFYGDTKKTPKNEVRCNFTLFEKI